MLALFVAVVRWIQKKAPWLHWVGFDRAMVKIWLWLIDRELK